MENFIKEGKIRFDFAAVSSHSKAVNANRMMLHMLAPKADKDCSKGSLFSKIITFKLYSGCPYKKEFYWTLENIQWLNIQLE